MAKKQKNVKKEMKVCPECGYKMNSETMICEDCGFEIKIINKYWKSLCPCNSCGYMNDKYTTYCKECGVDPSPIDFKDYPPGFEAELRKSSYISFKKMNPWLKKKDGKENHW